MTREISHKTTIDVEFIAFIRLSFERELARAREFAFIVLIIIIIIIIARWMHAKCIVFVCDVWADKIECSVAVNDV